jgi:hypothetical protein
VRRAKAALYQWVRDPPGYIAPAGSNWSSHGGNEVAEASDVKDRYRRFRECAGRNVSEHRASLEKVDAQAARQPFRGRLIRLGNRATSISSRCAGVVVTACTQGKRTQHGKPCGVASDDQPDAREGQAGRCRVAERLVVPRKPGNAGGGKGPQFKTDATSSEGPGDWAT